MAKRKYSIDLSSGGRTRQEFKNECDVNYLMERYARTGVLGDPTQDGKREAAFGDFTGVGDFMDCQSRILAAQEGFDSLPAKVRSRFEHDPGRVIAFLADDSNREESIELGLREKPVVAPVIAGGAPSGAPVVAVVETAPAPSNEVGAGKVSVSPPVGDGGSP